ALPFVAQRDGGHHGDVALLGQQVDDVGVDGLHVPHEAQIHGPVPAGGIHHLVALAGHHQVAVVARQTHRLAAVAVNEGHQLLVHLPHQHHLGDYHRLRVGDPHTVDEDGLLPLPAHEAADLAAAPVDQHQNDPHVFQKHEVEGHRLFQFRI